MCLRKYEQATRLPIPMAYDTAAFFTYKKTFRRPCVVIAAPNGINAMPPPSGAPPVTNASAKKSHLYQRTRLYLNGRSCFQFSNVDSQEVQNQQKRGAGFPLQERCFDGRLPPPAPPTRRLGSNSSFKARRFASAVDGRRLQVCGGGRLRKAPTKPAPQKREGVGEESRIGRVRPAVAGNCCVGSSDG